MRENKGMRAYSMDLRRRVLDAVDRGRPRAEIVDTLQVSVSTIKRYIRQRRLTADIAPKRPAGGKPSIAPEQHPLLREQLEQHDTATLQEHSRLWQASTGMAVSLATMSRTIRRLGWTRKKALCLSQTYEEMKTGGTMC